MCMAYDQNVFKFGIENCMNLAEQTFQMHFPCVHLTQSKFQTEKFRAWDFSGAAPLCFLLFFFILFYVFFFYEFVALG